MPVRLMLDADLPAVQALALQLWPDSPSEVFDGQTVFVWVSDGGAIGGFASMAIRPWVDGADSAPCPHLEGWFVAPELRRRGVGRALIAAAESWCRDQGFREMTSDALVENTGGLRAHAALGFDPTERIQYFRKSLSIDRPLSEIP